MAASITRTADSRNKTSGATPENPSEMTHSGSDLKLFDQNHLVVFYVPLSLSEDRKLRKTIKSIVSNLLKEDDPFEALTTINENRIKVHEDPFPIFAHRKSYDSQRLLDLLDNEHLVFEETFEKVSGPLSKRDLIREKGFKGKRNAKSRAAVKGEKKKVRESVRKNYIADKAISLTHRYDGSSSFFNEGSIVQLERKSQAEKNKLARKKEVAKSVSGKDALTARRLKQAAKKQEEADRNVAFFDGSTPRAFVPTDEETGFTDCEEDKTSTICDDDEDKTTIELPEEKTEIKVNSLGYTKEEVKAFREAKLLQKQGKRASKFNRREAARKELLNSTYSAIPYVDEAFSIPVSVTGKKKEEEREIVTQSGEDEGMCPVGALLSTLDSYTGSFVVFLYQCYRSRSIMDISAAAYQWLKSMGISIDSYVKQLIGTLITNCGGEFANWSVCKEEDPVDIGKPDWGPVDIEMKDYNESPLDGVETNIWSQSGVIDRLSEMFRSVMSGDLVVGLRDFFIALAGMKLLGGKFTKSMWNVFGSFTGKMSVVDFIEQILKSMSTLVRFGASVLSGMPLTEAIMSSDPISASCDKVDFLVRNVDYTYTGLPSPGRIALNDWLKTMQDHLKILESAEKGLSPRSAIRARVKQLILSGKIALAGKMDESEGASRVAPFGVILFGSSGMGKSHLLKYIAKVWSKVKGREFEPNQIYPRNPTSDYWEGYLPHSHPIVHYSEVARFSASAVKARGDPQIDEIVSLIDTMTFIPDMAFGAKGKVRANPELVICDSNNESLNAETLYHSEVAYLRRFLFIKPTVLSRFTKEGSSAIDPKKSHAAGGHPLDRYRFKVYTVYGDDNDRVCKNIIATKASLSSLTTILAGLFAEHMAVGELTREKMDSSELIVDVADVVNKVRRSFEKSIPKSVPHVREEPIFDFEDDEFPYSHGDFVVDAPKRRPFPTAKEFVETVSPFSRLKEYLRPKRQVDLSKIPDSGEDTSDNDSVCVEPAEVLIPELMEEIRNSFVERQKRKVHHEIKEEYETKYHQDEDVVVESGVVDAFNYVITRRSMIYDYIFGSRVVTAFNYVVSRYDVALDFISSFISFLYSYAMVGLLHEDERNYSFNPFRIVLYLILYKIHAVGFLMFPMFVIHYSNFLGNAANLVATRAIISAESRYSRAVSALRHRLFGEVYNPFRVRSERSLPYARIMRMVSALSAVVIAYKAGKGVYSFFTKKRKNPLTESDENDLEEYNLGYTPSVIKSKINSNIWTDKVDISHHVMYPPHSSGKRELYNSIIANVRRCKVEHSVGSVGKTFIYGIQCNFALINAHAFRNSESIVLHIATSSCHDNDKGWDKHTIRKEDCVRVTDDILLFTSSGLRFKNVIKHFTPTMPQSDFGAIVENKVVRVNPSLESLQAKDSYVGRVDVKRPLNYNVTHYAGMCGTPIVGDFGTHSAIYGLHFAGDKNSENGYGICITREMVESALSALLSTGRVLFRVSSQSGICNSSVVSQSGTAVGLRALPSLTDPGFKSIVNYEGLSQMTYFGKLPGPILMNKVSKLQHTPIAELVLNYFEKKGYEVDLTGRPIMKPFVNSEGEWLSPHNINMRKMANNKKVLDSRILVEIKTELVKRFVSLLRKEGVSKLTPLTVSEAINGVEGDDYIRRINASASAGFGFPGKKWKHLPLEEGSTTIRKPTPELFDKILATLELYRNGHCAHPIYSGKLKDEPRTLEKISLAKTRMFFMQPIDSLIVARMFLAPFYSLMSKFGYIFCTAVGTNMYVDADTMYNDIRKFALDVLEGDYGGYDVNMPHGVGETVCAVVLEVLEAMGYDALQLEIVRGILSDTLFPYVEILNDIFCVPGLQPSGKYATAEDNSLRGLVLLMYAWKKMGFTDNFFEKVKPYTYGDDIVAGSREPMFNNMTYAAAVKLFFGMDFTTPDKKVTTSAFVTVDEMSFLKRKFKHDERFGRVIAYLPVETFVKALMWTIPSRVVSPDDQLISTCASMCIEYAFLDSSTYDEFREFLKNCLVEHVGMMASHALAKLPTFEKVVSLTRTPNDCPPPLSWSGVDSDPEFCLYLEASTESGETERPRNVRSSIRRSIITRSAEEKEFLQLRKEVRDHPQFDMVFRSGIPLVKALRDPRVPIDEDYSRLIQRYYDVKVTRELKFDDDLTSIQTESGEIDSGPVSSSVIRTEENFEDIMGADENRVTAGTSRFPDIGQRTNLSLNDFFERPVEITEFALPLATYVNQGYRIWDIYTSKATIRAKLRNYAFFSANLHCRIAVSGTPFHRGKLLISYQPYSLSNTTLSKLRADVAFNPDMRPLLLNYLSQSPGSVIVDVKSNEPVEIEIPFISPKPMFRLFNSATTAISSVTSFEDITRAGELLIYSLNPVFSVSASPSYPRVQVYAWATDVKLGTSTGTQMAIVTESGEYDESKKGPIERFSSAAAQVSNALSKVPWITPYAKASNFMFMGMRTLASIYGYSKPIEHGEPSIVKPEPYQNGANVIGMDTNKRLVLDPKQELSVDPRVCATDKDEMVIAEIARRNTYLTTFNWSNADTPFYVMWQARVTPMLATTYSNNEIGRLYVQPTACMFATMPFNYWNGKMVYRFEVVASSFHRGKIAVIFEPNVSQISIIKDSLTTNKQYMTVIDIQETQTFDVEIDWASPRYWNETDVTTYPSVYGPTMLTANQSQCNGCIIVVPFTSLQSPDDSGIEVNVYAKCSDLRVNYLRTPEINERHVVTESGVTSPDDVPYIHLNPSTGSLDNCSEYHFGEEPVSFRSLLKRYVTTYVATVSAEASWTYGWVELYDRNFPVNVLPYGSTEGSVEINLWSYLSYAYLGAKGGIRKRARLLGDMKSNQMNQVKVTNGERGTADAPSINKVLGGCSRARSLGTVTFMPNTNGGIEYEAPYYSSNLFWMSFSDDMIGVSSVNEIDIEWNKRSRIAFDVTGPFSALAVEVESAAGEDFSFMRYQGAPYFSITS